MVHPVLLPPEGDHVPWAELLPPLEAGLASNLYLSLLDAHLGFPAGAHQVSQLHEVLETDKLCCNGDCFHELYPVSSTIFQPHRQDHVQEILLPLHRREDAGGDAGVQLQAHLVRRGVLEGVQEIAVVEADLQAAAVALHGADVLGFSDGRLGRHAHLPVLKDTADGGFLFL